MKKQTVTIIAASAITAIVVVIGLILLMPVIGPRYLHPLMMGGSAPVAASDLNTSTSVLTDQGLFRVSYTSDTTPPSLNQIHTWTIHVETADGQPVKNAEISVDGGMPQHGHGLPTSPQVTQNLGGGDYLVEGMKFQMLGWWEVKFLITANGQSDTVTFNIILE